VKFRIFIISVVIFLAGPAGCASVTQTTSNPSNVTVASLPILANIQLYAAQQLGLFAKQGLHVNIVNVEATPIAIGAMKAGEEPIISGANTVTFLSDQDRGVLSLKVLAEQSTCQPDQDIVVVGKNSPITKPSQLARATIAVNVLDSVQSMTINEVLQSEGVNTSHIRYVMVPFQEMPVLLYAHRIDAAAEVEPFLEEAYRQYGDTGVLDACEANSPTNGIPLAAAFATAQWVKDNPKTAREFQTAMQQAAVILNENHQLQVQIAEKDFHVSPYIAVMMDIAPIPATVDVTEMQRTADQMFNQKLMPKPLNVRSLTIGG
jgi:NitT/TauT family transport system substrate-binding protein